MQPTEPAAIARLFPPSRSIAEDRLAGVLCVVVGSVVFACVAALLADLGYASIGLACTFAVFAFGVVLQRIGAPEAWALIANALALAPLWCVTLFFRYLRWPDIQLDGLTLGVLLVAMPTVAVSFSWRSEATKMMARRTWVALAGIVLLWAVAIPGRPVDLTSAALVRMLSGS